MAMRLRSQALYETHGAQSATGESVEFVSAVDGPKSLLTTSRTGQASFVFAGGRSAERRGGGWKPSSEQPRSTRRKGPGPQDRVSPLVVVTSTNRTLGPREAC